MSPASWEPCGQAESSPLASRDPHGWAYIPPNLVFTFKPSCCDHKLFGFGDDTLFDQFLLTLWPDPLPKHIMSDIKALGDPESPVAIKVSGIHREKPPAPQVQRIYPGP